MFVGIGVGVHRQRFAGSFATSYSSRVIADGGTIEALDCVAAASSLLQSASLLIIPSGYKAGVVYAELPANGNGDLTWSRNSVANRTQSDGNIGSVAANVPRLSYMYGSCPALLLEPQRTNLITQSQNFADVSWTKVGIGAGSAPVVTANAGISPEGINNATRVQFNCGGTTISDRSILQKPSVSITNTTNYAASIYVKAYSSGEVGKQLRFIQEGVTSQSIITLTDSWQRVAITGTSATTTSNYIIETRGTLTTNTTADVLIYGAQLEAGAYPTTYIPTTNATATRLVDTFTRNNIYTNGLISASGGTWYVELRNNVAYTRDATNVGLFIGDDLTNSNGFAIRNTGTGRLVIQKFIATVNGNIYTTLTDTVKIAIKWNGTSADIFANGTKVVSATSFTTTILQFLSSSNNTVVPTFIQAMALYPTPLSDADCTTLTT